jgi:O-antigen/teichoic acid export membrane protein
MAFKKNLALMGFTTALRLLAGLISFSIMARILGPNDFGVFAYWLSVSMLLALVTNYGLGPYVLREIGINLSIAPRLIGDGMMAKLLLTLLVVLIASAATWVFEVDRGLLFGFLLIGTIADSFTEFLNTGLRASNRFDVETKIATIGAFSHAAIIASVVVIFQDIDSAAVAYSASRLVLLGLTIIGFSKYFSRVCFSPIRAGFGLIKKSVSYAIDFGFQSLFGQIDGLVLNYYSGPVSVGLHQAGMRVFYGGLSGLQVMANVFLPRASSMSADSTLFAREAGRIQMAFLLFGLTFGLFIWLFSDFIVSVLFGSEYLQLASLLPVFGLLFFVRMSAAAWGIILTASGEQKFRTIATIAHWMVVAIAAIYLVPSFNVLGWLVALIVGNVLLTFLYASRCLRKVEFPWITVAATIAGYAVFIPSLHSGG